MRNDKLKTMDIVVEIIAMYLMDKGMVDTRAKEYLNLWQIYIVLFVVVIIHKRRRLISDNL